MWWQVYVTWMVAAVSLMLGLMALLLWLNTRERLFGLLAAATFAWAVRLGLSPLETPPMVAAEPAEAARPPRAEREPQPRQSERRGERRPEERERSGVKGFGDDIPAFLRRPVVIPA